MRRISPLTLLAALLLAGCSGSTPPPPKPEPTAGPNPDVRQVEIPPKDKPTPVTLPQGEPADSGWTGNEVVASLPPPTPQEAYDAALHEAIDLLSERKYKEALAALEKAQKINDTGAVQREIDKVRTILAQQEGADKAIADVRSVLDAGKPDEASRLAAQALVQYGGGDSGEKLTALKREADALLAATENDGVARRARLRADADAARKENNLRASAVALEELLALGEDADLRKQYNDVNDRLSRYDRLRALALSLPRDPDSAEQALGSLRAAAEAWNTVQIRQEIDELTLIVNRRRARLSVADFEVRGDLGVPAAGRLVAEQLLPSFKSRFDLVERTHLGRVLQELKLESGDLIDDPASRRELARQARLRYLVVGSLTPLGGGVTASAQLVEVSTGLIVQTGTLSAGSVEDLLPRLKQLAALLQMTDEQKLAYESRLQAAPVVVKVIQTQAVVISPPPAPPAPAALLPSPIITYTPQPLALGGLVVADFRTLPAVVVTPPTPPALELVLTRDETRRNRLLALSLELGDNLFRRGRYRDANRHYQLALRLNGRHEHVKARIDRCREFLPPSAGVVFVKAAKPRLAVFSLLVNARPGLAPPAVGDWAADGLVSYLGNQYEVIERGEVCWYMGRLGITLRDLLREESARVCLAHALNVRFFVLGTIEQTASFDVNTHLIDAQTGARTGTAMIHVQDHEEMKLRMHELVRQMGVAPAEQTKLVKQGADSEKALGEARKLNQKGDYAAAVEVVKAALKSNPDNFALQTLLIESEAKAKQKALEDQRAKEAREQAAAQAEMRKRQLAMLKQMADARAKAEQEARAKGDALKAEQELRRAKAAEALRTQAKKDAEKGNLSAALQSLESAQALKATPEGAQALADVRKAVDRVNQEKNEAERKKAEADLLKKREESLARLARERAERDKAEAERRKQQEARDLATSTELVKKARELMGKKEYVQAQALAREAQRLKASDESGKLIQDAEHAIALAEAEKKGAAAKAEAEKKLEKERKDREAAEAETRKKQESYVGAMKEGQKALGEKRYDQAIGHFETARKLFATDAALTGLHQAEFRKQLELGKSKLAAKQFAEAVTALRKATELEPGNVEAKNLLAEAAKGLIPPSKPDPKKLAQIKADYDLAMSAGKDAMAKKNYQGAINAYTEALRLMKDDKAALAGRAEAERLLAESKKPMPPPVDPKVKKAREDYEKAMSAGREAMKVRNYQAAIKDFTAALGLIPDDKQAKAAKEEAERLFAAEEMKRVEAEFAKLMAQGQAMMTAKKFADAVTAYTAAKKLKPTDAGAAKALADAEKALADSKKPMPPVPPAKVDPKAKQLKEDYELAMSAGKAAMAKKNYQGAINAYTEALRLMKDDRAALAAKTEAERLLADEKKRQAEEEKKKKEDAEFARLMTQGQAAMTAKKFADAVTAYTAAKKLKPTDAAASKGLADAEKAQADEKKRQADEEKKKKDDAEFARLMTQGQTAMAGKRYADAVTAYTAAKNLRPTDAGASKALADAQKAQADEKKFQDHLSAAKTAHTAKRYADAIKSYEEALKIQPGNAEAQNGLQRAKMNKP
jgi:tetratricopeptide (TPR) repeat protein